MDNLLESWVKHHEGLLTPVYQQNGGFQPLKEEPEDENTFHIEKNCFIISISYLLMIFPHLDTLRTHSFKQKKICV